MGMISGLSQAASAYRAASETLDQAKIAAATNELTLQITHFGAQVVALNEKALQATERERAALARVHHLEGEVRKLEQRISERERYELVEDYPGTFTLCIKESARGSEPLHHICPGCMDNKAVKSILQSENTKRTFLKCPACQTSYRMAETPSRPTRIDRGAGWMER
ncbi:hypothetical protein [Bordetella petrii]|uniref:hypothetical protein n=1 Tax=Bordetella petrii TaxID=94624 RepID=UPI0012DF477E|nr:hypothetical protein [Bordetella petrii]